MIKAQYAVLYEFNRRGAQGTNDFLGVFDRVFAPQLPAAHRQMTFTVALYAETEDDLGKHDFTLRVVDPKGRTTLEQQGSFVLAPVAGTWLAAHTMNFAMQGMPFSHYGRYWFRMEVDGQEVAAHPLTVARPPETAS
jgi:hypothetical protein